MSKFSGLGPSEPFTIFRERSGTRYFFSNDHLQRFKSVVSLDGFVVTSVGLPMNVPPRAEIPDGVIRTLDQYLEIHHQGHEEIPNPDKHFQPFPIMEHV